MTKKKKIFEKLKNNPKDVRFDDIKKMLEEKGFELKRISGSHFIFSKGEVTFVIPSHNNKVKEIYVKRVIDIIENHEVNRI